MPPTLAPVIHFYSQPLTIIIKLFPKTQTTGTNYQSTAKMRSQIKMDELEAEQNRWLKALDDGGDDKICRLASSFRRGDRCTIFQPHKQGSFNVCFFVEFNSPRERWVVRLPMPGAVPKAIMDEKTEVEVATMR